MIPVQNLYHMLAYAFRALREQGYRDLATEEFENAAELCAAILERGVAAQIKRGLRHDYHERSHALSSVKGKIEVSASITSRAFLRHQMVCTVDEYSADSMMNRIMKSTLQLLLRSDISTPRKKALRRLVLHFADVRTLDLRTVDWALRYDRHNQTYRLLMGVCWLVAKGLLQTQADGRTRLMEFFDEQRMSRLYEAFILEYYRREHPELHAAAPHIPWALDDGFSDMLPTMRSDITLRRDGHVLIIDAKYYSHTTQERFDRRSVHSGNLYQIFTYVKNAAASLGENDHEVSGLLLYARTDEEIHPHATYQMSGNSISVQTLDLNLPFAQIAAQLDDIAERHCPRPGRSARA